VLFCFHGDRTFGVVKADVDELFFEFGGRSYGKVEIGEDLLEFVVAFGTLDIEHVEVEGFFGAYEADDWELIGAFEGVVDASANALSVDDCGEGFGEEASLMDTEDFIDDKGSVVDGVLDPLEDGVTFAETKDGRVFAFTSDVTGESDFAYVTFAILEDECVVVFGSNDAGFEFGNWEAHDLSTIHRRVSSIAGSDVLFVVFGDEGGVARIEVEDSIVGTFAFWIGYCVVVISASGDWVGYE